MPVVHKPTTRWLGMSLGWAGALNVAAALAPHGEAKKKLLIANGVGLLGGGERFPYSTRTDEHNFSMFGFCYVWS